VAFLAALQVLGTLERKRAEQLQRDSLADNEVLLGKWLDLASQPLRRFVQDFSQWDALAAYVRTPEQSWAEANLRPNLAAYEAHALWVLDHKGSLLYSAQANPGPALPPPELPASDADNPGGSFFVESREGLLEVWAHPVAPSASGSAGGWLLLARQWGGKHLAALGQLSDAELLLVPADQPAVAESAGREIRRPLPGADGRPVRTLVVRQALPDFSANLARDTRAAYLFLGFGILVVLALWLAVRQWVLRPLDHIGESLRRNDPALIRSLISERTELGRIAQLVESASRQQTVLEREIEDRKRTEDALRDSEARLRHALDLRARLARDLHDGVIQSIYAAGLGLEGAMTQMEKDAAGARARLQLCRQSLNDVIREVRGFISGIEPEALHHQGFDQELTALVRTMQALWPVVINVQTNPVIVTRMTPTLELHALQICRECISNAVRHGGAREISIHLGEEAGAAFLRVRDNGRGFNPAAPARLGSGLGNLAARARELGGRLDIESRPGGGATFTVTFPLPPALS
jgi:signal transduction histidine kinase